MGSIKLIIGVVLIVAVVWVCGVLIPPYFANYQFEDALENEARMSTYSTKAEDAIRDSVFKKAQELEIPLTREQIKVHRVGQMGSGSVTIEAQYTVHVEVPGYPMDLHFDAATKNKGAF